MNRRQRRHSDPPPAGVVLAWMHPGQVAGAFCESVAGELLHDSAGKKRIVGHGGYLCVESGPRIASTRTRIVNTFLDFPGEAEWLWMVDADMTFRPGTLEALMSVANAERAPIVGGLCFAGGRERPMFPTLYVMSGDGKSIDTLKDWPRDTVVKVDATGAACLLVHRTVFELMRERWRPPYPWFAETWLAGNEIGEDVTFCLRARQLGLPVTVHTGVKIGHVKHHTLDESLYDERRRIEAGAETRIQRAQNAHP